MSELDEVIKGLTEAHKANGNLMISLPGGASVLNVLQLVEHLRKEKKRHEIQPRYHNRQAHRAHR